MLAVAGWGAYLALARAGVNEGLHLADFLMLRFGVAGLVMLPLLPLRRSALRALGLWRALALTALVGPVFTVVGVGGYRFAPLAHGAVIQPVTVTVVVTLVAVAFMGERMSLPRLLGVGCAMIGVVLVGFGAPAAVSGGGPTWVGDLLFVGAGVLWGAFTLLLRRWQVDPLVATGAVVVLSALVVVPGFVAFDTFGRLLALSPGMLLAQAFVQGVLSGVVALIAYGIAVRNLGAAASAVFPAMVPVAATLIGVPITGEAPAPVQAVGLVLATAGLVGSMVRWRR